MLAAINNKQIKFLPRNIYKMFPNLEAFYVQSCGLTIVREFYFENMESLRDLNLYGNQIKTIEAKAFDDLVGLKRVNLDLNEIETLDEELFVKMAKLEVIYLNKNKIKFLGQETFDIPGGRKQLLIHLMGNICIDGFYAPNSDSLLLELALERCMR